MAPPQKQNIAQKLASKLEEVIGLNCISMIYLYLFVSFIDTLKDCHGIDSLRLYATLLRTKGTRFLTE